MLFENVVVFFLCRVNKIMNFSERNSYIGIKLMLLEDVKDWHGAFLYNKLAAFQIIAGWMLI